jgi:nitrite reductase (NADH) small subunit
VRVNVCSEADFAIGEVRRVVVNGRPVALSRSSTEDFHAVRDICPHKGADLSAGECSGTNLPSPVGSYLYGLDNLVLRCPWHNYEFDVRTGEQLFIGGTEARAGGLRVRAYPVFVEDGYVYVETGRAE